MADQSDTDDLPTNVRLLIEARGSAALAATEDEPANAGDPTVSSEQSEAEGGAPAESDLGPEPERVRQKPAACRPFGTDTFVAEDFIKEHARDLRYCGPWKRWAVYYGGRWKVDGGGLTQTRIKSTVRRYWSAASRLEEGSDSRKAWEAFAKRSESAKGRENGLKAASWELAVQVEPEEFDSHPMLFNLANGTLDLEKGELGPHRREDLLMKRSPVTYDPAAKAPTWERFLDRIFDGNKAVIGFVQRAAGYSLTGDIKTHALILLWGNGQNGKTTLLEALLALLGPYGIVAAPELLMASHQPRHLTEVADLKGARLVTSSETEDQGRFNESRVKALTGGGTLKARRMHEDLWEFTPTHHLWLDTNHKPRIRGTDKGIWRRINLVPFTVEIPDSEKNENLPKELRRELPGILNWCLAGLKEYQRIGLKPPEEVRAATDAYRAEQDQIARFVAECCITGKQRQVPVDDVYRSYYGWATEANDYVASKVALGTRLDEMGFKAAKDSLDRRIRKGLALLTNRAPPVSDEFDTRASSPAHARARAGENDTADVSNSSETSAKTAPPQPAKMDPSGPSLSPKSPTAGEV